MNDAAHEVPIVAAQPPAPPKTRGKLFRKYVAFFVAVVVMVEHGGEGSMVAAPLAKQIMEAALQVVH